ncbi:MAG: DNA-binding protein [Burkholderiales bacterium]|nr:DNA-binding protein [Burkholderiales bacterium]
MSEGATIQSEIESLKERFSETKALYREVCALLFFRHGITPTASKLYQYVRKGSMSAPADALAKFWEELREKARVQIDHPDLPEALKLAAAEAVHTLWGQATDMARTELASLRVEARAETDKALADLAIERDRASRAEARAHELQGEVDTVTSQLQARSIELESERRLHAATAARTEVLQRQVDELQSQHDRIRSDFSAELEKGRSTIDSANERAIGAERRALLDIDQARTGRDAAQKQLESARVKLAEVERLGQIKALELVTTNARVSAELEAAQAAVKHLTATVEGQGEQLQEAQQRASQFKAEADTLRSLVEQFKPSQAPRPSRAKRGAA